MPKPNQERGERIHVLQWIPNSGDGYFRCRVCLKEEKKKSDFDGIECPRKEQCCEKCKGKYIHLGTLNEDQKKPICPCHSSEESLPCPHGRSHWGHCPHCLGINRDSDDTGEGRKCECYCHDKNAHCCDGGGSKCALCGETSDWILRELRKNKSTDKSPQEEGMDWVSDFDSTFTEDTFCACGGEYDNENYRNKVKDFIHSAIQSAVKQEKELWIRMFSTNVLRKQWEAEAVQKREEEIRGMIEGMKKDASIKGRGMISAIEQADAEFHNKIINSILSSLNKKQ